MRAMLSNALTDASARENLWSRARRALASEGPVPSPCVSVCQMDAAIGLCAGCLRSLDEIAIWSTLDDSGRRGVWLELSKRARAPELTGDQRRTGGSAPPV